MKSVDRKYTAPRLTVMALHWARQRYPDAMLTTELAVEAWGMASLDVAAVTPSEIIGIEIKGDGDSVARLERQGWIYSRAATWMWLLTAPSLEAAAAKKCPDDWLRLVVDQEDEVVLSDSADSRLEWVKWTKTPGPSLPNSAKTLAGMLWADEAREFARLHGIDGIRARTYRHVVTDTIAEQVPLATIRAGVCETLRARYSRGIKRPKVVYYPGDELPSLQPEAAT